MKHLDRYECYHMHFVFTNTYDGLSVCSFCSDDLLRDAFIGRPFAFVCLNFLNTEIPDCLEYFTYDTPNYFGNCRKTGNIITLNVGFKNISKHDKNAPSGD